jgi:hypothetical protein
MVFNSSDGNSYYIEYKWPTSVGFYEWSIYKKTS